MSELFMANPEMTLFETMQELRCGLQDYLEEHGDCEHGSIVALLRQVDEAIATPEGPES